MSEIKIKNIRKVYRIGQEKVVALNKVSFDIKKGEICCFLGTSGSGKSTLLNLMAGLEKPTKGSIMIKGTRMDRLNEKELAKFRQNYLGFIFQSYNLLPALTAVENVAMPLVFKGVSKKKREEMALKTLRNVGLKTHVKHKPTQMSGGQQQRVGIARAFVGNHDIVFADEPTGNLDSKTSKEVMELMVDLTKKNNQTLVLVTHDRSIATYADRVIHILDGNIENIELKDENGEFMSIMDEIEVLS